MSPRSKEKFEEIREESKEKILYAAMRVFARDGYDGATIRAIVREAGISQGLLYNYYASKEELLKAVYLRGMQDVGASFIEAEAVSGTPAEKLAALIRSSFRYVQENKEFWQLSYNLRMQGAVLAASMQEIKTSVEVILKQLESLLGEMGYENSMVEAAILFAIIDGVSQHYVLNPIQYRLTLVEEQIIRNYCSR